MTRDEKGRFAPGNEGGPGRKPKQTEAEYLAILSARVPKERWIKIIDKAVDQAERGDTAARKWISDYLMGTPVQRTELSGVDGAAIPVELFIRALEKVYGDD